MSGGIGVWTNHDVTNTALPLGTETALVSVACRGLRAGQKVAIIAFITIQGTVGSTTVTITIRRGTGIAGTIIGEAMLSEGTLGTNRTIVTAIFFDNAARDDQDYIVTGTIAGAAGTAETFGIQAALTN